jgi:hypothetical protein
MLTQMYVVIASGGSYDDAWSHPEFVTPDQKLGQHYVDRMNAFSEEVAAAIDNMNQFDTAWRMANPRPAMSYLDDGDVVVVPRWTSNQKITQEMRDERRRLEEINSEALKRRMAPINEWTQRWWAAHNEYKASLSKEIQHGIDKNYNDTRWEIEPIAWLTETVL